MSDTTQQPEINHQPPSAPQPAPAPEPAAPAATPEPTEAEKAAAAEKRGGDRRFAQLSAKLAFERTQNQQLAARLEALEKAGKPPADPVTLKPEDLERQIDQRAAQKVAEREMQERAGRFESAGAAEFGQDEFRDHCNSVAALATPQQRAALLQVVTDLDDGHKAIAVMADNPDEASKILAMPPHRMALALAKLTAAPPPAPAPPPKPFSKAPAPIKPVSGAAKAEFDESTATAQELVAYYAKQARERRAGR